MLDDIENQGMLEGFYVNKEDPAKVLFFRYDGQNKLHLEKSPNCGSLSKTDLKTYERISHPKIYCDNFKGNQREGIEFILKMLNELDNVGVEKFVLDPPYDCFG